MSPALGTRLGPYEITAKLGEGGMGEVYRATDTKLKREVAIKVLPAEFTADKERLARFEREAQLLAQLHHPNIASIFGLEDSDGTKALVMELVEGPTLAERLESGALPFNESLSVSLQIAHALEEAHEKGIVHRDLKPQNVKASIEGKVKVLDFGLAKAMDPIGAASGSGAGSATQLAASPTLTLGATQMGVILGTAAYMAPEQAKGMPVDKRADIWAFGVVLWEMLTGRRLYEAPTVPETLAQVLTRDPDLGPLPAGTPPAIRRLLRRCLERNPKNRLHDIADARIVLADLAAGRSSEEPALEAVAGGAATPGRRKLHLAWLAGALAATAVAFVAGRDAEPGAPAPPATKRLAIQLAATQEVVAGSTSLLRFTPDGGALVFTGRESGRKILLRYDFATGRATAIEGTEGGDTAFFSPDGAWLAFRSGGELLKVATAGGRPIPLAAELRGSGGATWLGDGTIVFAPIYSDGLFRISAEGGEKERLTTPDRAAGELGHWWPEPLPGERYLLFTAFRAPVDRSRIGVYDRETKSIRYLVEGGVFARYLPSGHLLYARGERLWAAPFDAASAAVLGPAVPQVDDLSVSQTGGYAQYTVAPDGTLAYVRQSSGSPPSELAWFERDGRMSAAFAERRQFVTVDLSPDDRLAAVTIQGESRDLWTLALERGTLSRLTTSADTEFAPVWSADGRELFYVVDRPPFELFRLALGRPDSGRPVWSEKGELDRTGIAAAPDGATLAFVQSELETGDNVYLQSVAADATARPLRVSRSEERHPAFSPDGRWIAYAADDTGRNEIYVESLGGGGERIQVSSEGGDEPVWAANGDLFFRHHDTFLVAATRPGSPIAVAPPVRLFSSLMPSQYGGDEELRSYDVTRDGRRILAIVVPESLRSRRIEIATDWTSEVARRVPRGAP